MSEMENIHEDFWRLFEEYKKDLTSIFATFEWMGLLLIDAQSYRVNKKSLERGSLVTADRNLHRC